MANTKSAEKAARQSTAHRARNDALTSRLRSAIRKATLALKAGKRDDAAAALAARHAHHRQHGQQGHHSPQQGRTAQESADQTGAGALEVGHLGLSLGLSPSVLRCHHSGIRLEVAHHRLFQFIGPLSRRTGNQQHRTLPSQPPHDFFGAPRGLLRLEQIDLVDHQPALLGGEIGCEFLEFTDDGACPCDRVGVRIRRREVDEMRRGGLMPRNVAIGLGLMEFPFAGVAGFWRWVDLCEAGGIDSLWQTDRMISREPILECMSVMAALAGRTRRLKFGVNVLSLAFRDPVLLAKQCATIDVLSEGRLLPAFGIGSPLAPEWRTLNLDTKTRGRKTDEGLEIIRRLWREDEVDFEGVHYRLTGASIAPKPVQPDLPMWIGGSSEAAIRRTARFGTGWQAGAETPAQVGAGHRRASARRPPPRDARSTTTITAPASRSASVGPTIPVSPACSKPTASVPDATRCIILRSAMQARSSSGSPPMSMPESPNSSCGRRPAATTRCWGRRGG